MANFPAINTTGVITQLPYREVDESLVSISDLDCGMRYAYRHGDPARHFLLSYQTITRTEAQVLEDFFVSMRGRVGKFTWTDDAGSTHPNCRFDQDEFSLRYAGPDECAVDLRIAEFV